MMFTGVKDGKNWSKWALLFSPKNPLDFLLTFCATECKTFHKVHKSGRVLTIKETPETTFQRHTGRESNNMSQEIMSFNTFSLCFNLFKGKMAKSWSGISNGGTRRFLLVSSRIQPQIWTVPAIGLWINNKIKSKFTLTFPKKWISAKQINAWPTRVSEVRTN